VIFEVDIDDRKKCFYFVGLEDYCKISIFGKKQFVEPKCEKSGPARESLSIEKWYRKIIY